MKGLTTFSLLFLSFYGFSQVKFDEYIDELYDKSFNIEINGKNSSKYEFWIYAHSSEKEFKECGFRINQHTSVPFFKHLFEAKKKYIEWTEIAKKNNIKNYSKKMNIKCRVPNFFRMGKSLYYGVNKKLNYIFRVTDTGNGINYSLSVGMGEIQASTSQYVQHSGFYIHFLSPEEINKFSEKFSSTRIINHFDKKNKYNELFKD